MLAKLLMIKSASGEVPLEVFNNIKEAELVSQFPVLNDQMGVFLSLDSTGTRCIASVHAGDPSGISNAGYVLIFVRNTITNVWGIEATLSASDKAPSNIFGCSVAINELGDRCIIGAYNASSTGANNSGKAYIFSRSGTTWTQEAILTASDKATNDWFGYMVYISGDGARCIAGSPKATPSGVTNAGKAYIFSRSGTTWTQEAILTASDKVTYDWFGYSVSMDGTGTRCVVGSVYANPSSQSDAGKAYIFIRSGTIWTQEAILSASDKSPNGDRLGYSVDMSGDGTRIIVGAPYATPSGVTNAGKAYIFSRSGTTWTQEAILTASDKATLDYFSSSVSIDDTGRRCIVGAYAADAGGLNNAGSAYIFTRSGINWSQEAIVLNMGKVASDQFGAGVAIAGDGIRCSVGASAADIVGTNNVGKVYIYK
jgi:hypothetical protein